MSSRKGKRSVPDDVEEEDSIMAMLAKISKKQESDSNTMRALGEGVVAMETWLDALESNGVTIPFPTISSSTIPPDLLVQAPVSNTTIPPSGATSSGNPQGMCMRHDGC